ncbi:Vps51/Vps67 protein [Entamoeba histolytica HM-3:IMSS]|uniref:Vacuolar protein sorting-associated protein 51 homolog n=1 Tax=Entamoeba histolytica HM-3:IMSS TaxID=885315 RepID=M7WDH5_ENTHI|nr:Vps51/Vps67 protein [Entamoeba histolytica HM-3:IMSS]
MKDNDRCSKFMANDLGKVLSYDEMICNRIQENDKKLKDLVYSNYSKFIQVTETITKIRHSAESFDNDLTSISKSLSELTSRYKNIHANLSPLREELISLHEKQQQIEQQQEFLDLPDILRQTASESKWIEFANAYTSKIDGLKKNAHIKAFASILAEVEGAVARAEKALNNAISKEYDTPQKLGQCYGALARLHTNEAAVMEINCIAKMQKYCEVVVDNSFTKKESNVASFSSFISTAATAFVNAVQSCCEAYNTAFKEPFSLDSKSFDNFVGISISNFYSKANDIVSQASSLDKPELKVVEALRGISDATGKIKNLNQYGDYNKYIENTIENAARFGIKELCKKVGLKAGSVFDTISVDIDLCVSRGFVGFNGLAEKKQNQIDDIQKELKDRIDAIKQIGGVYETTIINSLKEYGSDILTIFLQKAESVCENKPFVCVAIAGWILSAKIPETIAIALRIDSLAQQYTDQYNQFPEKLIKKFTDLISEQMHSSFIELFAMNHPPLSPSLLVRSGSLKVSSLMIGASNILKVYFPDNTNPFDDNTPKRDSSKTFYFDSDESKDDLIELERTSIIEAIVVKTMKQLRNDIPLYTAPPPDGLTLKEFQQYHVDLMVFSNTINEIVKIKSSKIENYIKQINLRLESCCSEGAITATNEVSLIKEAMLKINN